MRLYAETSLFFFFLSCQATLLLSDTCEDMLDTVSFLFIENLIGGLI